MLEIINKRIEYLYDRDHMIGHSYFMSLKNNQTIEELTNIFRNKIIPLLQEYFYDDWEKIKLILNDNGMIKEKKFEENLFKTQLDEYDDKKVFYIDESSFKKENFISIYKNEKQ
jgi:5-methylcytosine-specific restriction protein B